MPTDDIAGYDPTKAGQEPPQMTVNLPPPLPAEAPKAPWRPKVAGVIAFFFGPFAGALVVAISLRRMGHPQSARKILWLALALGLVEGVVLFFVPDTFARLVGLGAEVAFLLFFPVLMEKEFNEWQATHSISPSNGWKAIGWGLIGMVLLVIVIFLTSVALYALFPLHE